jgi:hypothetical protein
VKALKISTLIFLFSIMHLNKIYAQRDYIINLKKDTILCKIRINGFNGNLQYRVNKNDKFTNIKADLVIQYFLAKDTSTYMLKNLPGDKPKDYVKLLEQGNIFLYEYNFVYPNGSIETYWYASKNSGNLIQIKHSSFSIVGIAHSQKNEKESFINLFSENPTLQEEFNGTIKRNYDFDTIRDCIKLYNITDNNKSTK